MTSPQGKKSLPNLTLLLTCGLEDGGRRAAIALGVGLSALSEGESVHLFLSLESVVLATRQGVGDMQPRGFSDPLQTYIEHFVDLGGHLEVCASCYEEYCRHLKEEGGQPILRESVEVRGLNVISERAVHARVLTF